MFTLFTSGRLVRGQGERVQGERVQGRGRSTEGRAPGPVLGRRLGALEHGRTWALGPGRSVQVRGQARMLP